MPIADLTKSFVSTVMVPDGRRKIEYFDRDIKGWYLEVRSGNAKTFYFRYRDAIGHQRSLRISKFNLLDYESVRNRVLALRDAILHGRFDEMEIGNEKKLSLQEFVDQFYLPFIKKKKRSWETDVSFLDNHIIPEFGQKKLHQIKKMDLVKFHLSKRESGLASATVDRMIVLIRYMYNLALKWEVKGVEFNPAAKFDLFNENNAREKFLSQEEARRLILEIERSKNMLLKPIILILLLTGMRKSEVLNARWEDLDLNNHLWTVPISKSGKPRYIPLTNTVVKILNEIPRNFDLIFANPRTGNKYKNIFYSWDQARERAGLSDVRLHDLRHTYASFLINGGRSIYEVQKLLGHSSLAMTQRYAHLDQKVLLEASDVAANFLKEEVFNVSNDYGKQTL